MRSGTSELPRPSTSSVRCRLHSSCTPVTPGVMDRKCLTEGPRDATRGAWLTPSLSALVRGAETFLQLLQQLYWGTKGRLLLPTKSQVQRRLPFGNEAYHIQNAGSAKCQAAPYGPADGVPC